MSPHPYLRHDSLNPQPKHCYQRPVLQRLAGKVWASEVRWWHVLWKRHIGARAQLSRLSGRMKTRTINLYNNNNNSNELMMMMMIRIMIMMMMMIIIIITIIIIIELNSAI